MRRKTLGDGKKRIWFLDQYRNPHELKFSVHHVLEWFDRCGIDYVNSAPQSSTGMDPLGGSGGGLLYHHRLQAWERDMSRESIKTNWATAKELLFFVWRGKNWWLTPTTSSGNYDNAIPAVGRSAPVRSARRSRLHGRLQ